MPPEHDALGRYVVDIVTHRMGGRLEVRIEAIDVFCDEFRVEAVPEIHHRKTDDGENGSVQRAPPCKVLVS